VTDRLAPRRRLARGPLSLAVLALVVFAALFLSEPAAHSTDALVSTSPADIAAGQVLYEEHCQSCHGYEGKGGVVTGAPALVSVGAAAADFYLSTGRMPLNAPNNEALRHHQSLFTPEQERQLVAYIADLPAITGTNVYGPSIPVVEPLCADQTSPTTVDLATTNPGCVTLSEGQQLYAINCAQCHQAAGSGGMLSGGDVVPSLHDANLTQIAEAPLIGPKPMPIFYPALNLTQLSAIAQYVHYLHDPNGPGGFGISHFGPVAEGFVGILVGFVLLWFASRMIGNRG
jgi:ubiquinol-cytochrome c reductase cytochrome c subunit